MSYPTRRTVARALAVLIPLLAASSASAGWKPADGLGPKPGRCGVGCWGSSTGVLSVSWLADFTVDPLIVRPKERVHGQVTPLEGGSHLKGWNWPRGDCNPDTLKCSWKAGYPTRQWVRLGMAWKNDVGAAVTEAVYAVVGKDDAVLEGYVRDQAGDGVGGITVRVAAVGGHGGVYAVTGSDGFYNAIVKPGKYDVYPSPRARKKDRFDPTSRTVKVAEGKETRVDFTLKTAMKLTLAASTRTLVASGDQTADLTIHVERDGADLAGVKVDVWPQGSAPAETAKVPVVLCLAGGRFWPTADPGVAGAALPRSVITDGNGDAHLILRAGTVPGSVEVTAWAEDGFGHLRTKDVDDVSDTVRFTFTPPQSDAVDFLHFEERLEEYVSLHGIDLISSSAAALADQLTQLAPAAGLGGFSFTPILKTQDSEQAVLVTYANRPGTLGTGRTFRSDGLVIPFSRMTAIDIGAFRSFAGAARLRQLAPFPGLDAWAAGLGSGWSYREGTPATAVSGWAYLGWPRTGGSCR
jgi:hypothetical protein